jgi:hydrogenase nickel incorporation protein HypA/HybF
MHELSLCRAIVDIVNDSAGGRPVSNVAVQIGHLRQVVPATLEFCWQLTTEDTPLAGTRLQIEHVPAVAHCPACDHRWQLERPVLVCPECAGRTASLESGEEFLIRSIDVLEVT